MNLNTRIPCPNCGSKKNKQIPGHRLACNKCGTEHDGRPNEHGRALHSDPVKNASMYEYEERQRGR